jgi:uroporphyrinogen decarboxylase
MSHQEPDRVPFDLTSTLVTGIHHVAYERLRVYLGMSRKDTRIFDRVQGLARVDDDMLEYLGVDTRGVLTGNFSGWELKIEQAESYEQFDDAWGVTWRRPKPHGLYYDMVKHPLQGATLSEIKTHTWPDPRDEKRMRDLKKESSELAKTDCLVVLGTTGLTAGLLQTFQWLMGYEDAYCSLAGDEKLSRYLIQKLAELDVEFWEWAIPYLGEDIKVVLYADDFGMQNGPALSYGTFKKYFHPWYSRIFSCIKSQRSDLKIFFHTCGSSRYVFQDLIDSGVDILNPVQYTARDMDPSQLKRDFGSQVTLWGGGIDTQRVLPRGSISEVKDEVKKQLDALAPGGGFVFNTVHNIQADVPPENIVAMWETLREHGAY